ncbi:MAG TPA: response regulator [Thermoanaerobaculaceae bacterium]|nr:response regulator [Thermoanaerobaculaceae bacterium]HRS16060.1 response regulator [Thermoanaerobaculaceae bacterium]
MSWPRKTVLVVDDEEPFLLSLVDALAPHASLFRVVTALSGVEALELVGRLGPDLVITDLKMAGMDGLELMRRLQAIQPRLPVIVMTAFNSPQIEKEVAALRPVAVLDKPLDLEALLRTVVRTLFPIVAARTGAGTALVVLAIVTSTLAAAPVPRPQQPSLGGYVRAGAPGGEGPAGQDWRIATCSDPRA